MFFRADQKNNMAAIASAFAETFFDFYSENAERNSMKLNWKQDLNVLYQICVFRGRSENKMAALADSSKRWHIVLRCTICGPLGLLLFLPLLFIPIGGKDNNMTASPKHLTSQTEQV